MVEIISIAHMPSELTLYAALYRDVQNAAFLREQLLAGNEEFEYAFVDASMV
jgi:EKC/KEOPS complex subunit CGI121/TPRKB